MDGTNGGGNKMSTIEKMFKWTGGEMQEVELTVSKLTAYQGDRPRGRIPDSNGRPRMIYGEVEVWKNGIESVIITADDPENSDRPFADAGIYFRDKTTAAVVTLDRKRKALVREAN